MPKFGVAYRKIAGASIVALSLIASYAAFSLEFEKKYEFTVITLDLSQNQDRLGGFRHCFPATFELFPDEQHGAFLVCEDNTSRFYVGYALEDKLTQLASFPVKDISHGDYDVFYMHKAVIFGEFSRMPSPEGQENYYWTGKRIKLKGASPDELNLPEDREIEIVEKPLFSNMTVGLRKAFDSPNAIDAHPEQLFPYIDGQVLLALKYHENHFSLAKLGDSATESYYKHFTTALTKSGA